MHASLTVLVFVIARGSEWYIVMDDKLGSLVVGSLYHPAIKLCPVGAYIRTKCFRLQHIG